MLTAVEGADAYAAAISGTMYQSDGVTPLTGDSSAGVSAYTGSPCDIYTWVSDSNFDPSSGEYTLSSLPGGTYYLQTYSSGSYLAEWWASPLSVPDCSSAQSITVTDEQTVTDINFQMVPAAAISGTVYQIDGVTPLTGDSSVGVLVYSGSPCDSYTWAIGSNVDPATGEYTLSGLSAGTYYLQAYSSGSYFDEWWASPQSVLDCSEAQSITVAAGQTVTGINFALAIQTSTGCTASLDANLALHIPYIIYSTPLSSVSLSADFSYEFNPAFIVFKYINSEVMINPSFSCTAATLSGSLVLHIPDILLSDGTTHLWADLEYSGDLSNSGDIYFIVANFGYQ